MCGPSQRHPGSSMGGTWIVPMLRSGAWSGLKDRAPVHLRTGQAGRPVHLRTGQDRAGGSSAAVWTVDRTVLQCSSLSASPTGYVLGRWADLTTVDRDYGARGDLPNGRCRSGCPVLPMRCPVCPRLQLLDFPVETRHLPHCKAESPAQAPTHMSHILRIGGL